MKYRIGRSPAPAGQPECPGFADVATVTGDGRIVEVSGPEGMVRELGVLGETLAACVVAPGEHHAATEGTVEAYAEQLSKALLLRDPQMTSAQLFLLEQTRYLAEESLTQTLIDLLRAPNQSPPMVALAKELLAQRRIGADAMIAALKTAEMTVLMGLAHSKLAYPMPRKLV